MYTCYGNKYWLGLLNYRPKRIHQEREERKKTDFDHCRVYIPPYRNVCTDQLLPNAPKYFTGSISHWSMVMFSLRRIPCLFSCKHLSNSSGLEWRLILSIKITSICHLMFLSIHEFTKPKSFGECSGEHSKDLLATSPLRRESETLLVISP